MAIKKRKTELHRAEIQNSTLADNVTIGGMYVNYIAENQEILSTSEIVEKVSSCNKNIVSHIKLSHGRFMIVHDKRNEKNVKKYKLFADGSKSPM